MKYIKYNSIFEVQFQMDIEAANKRITHIMRIILLTAVTAEQAIHFLNKSISANIPAGSTALDRPEIISIKKVNYPLIAVEGMERSSK